MPKKRKRAEKRHYECSEWECKYDGVIIDSGSPVPITCMCGSDLITGSYNVVDEEDEDDDFVPPTAKGSPRPGWYKARRVEKKNEATSPGGTLYCQICGEEIEVNDKGKEVWTSKSGKVHVTSPNLDHYSGSPISPTVTGGVTGVTGDWIQRKRKLRGNRSHMKKSTPERKQIERDVFNASPLRTTHMTCNCSRPKN